MGMMTKLDAVNRMLKPTGRYPVNTLDADTVNDASVAEQILDEITLDVQIMGQNWNTVCTKVTPDSNGFISVGSDTISVDTTGDDVDTNVVLRGYRLFDVENNTDVWALDTTLEIQLRTFIGFEDLPTAVQYQIVTEASADYEMFVQGDANVGNRLARKEIKGMIEGRRENMMGEDATIFDGRGNVAASIANRNRRYYNRR